LDKDFSMPKLGPGQSYLNILDSLPQESAPVIRRWETFRSIFPQDAFEATVDGGKWKGAAAPDISKKDLRLNQLLELFDELKNAGAFDRYKPEYNKQRHLIHGSGRKVGLDTRREWNEKLKEIQLLYQQETHGNKTKPAKPHPLNSQEYDLKRLSSDVKQFEPYWRWFWRNAN
jgi:hypothetical protein